MRGIRNKVLKRSDFNRVILTICFFVSMTAAALSYESNAKTAIVIDDLTGTILLEKNSSIRIPPASMSKLMTLYMIFDALRDERIHMTDMIRVSKNASTKGGSKMFLNEGQMVSIEDIIRGIIIHSGNDACIAIAETLSGTENEFAKDMNSMAESLGITNSFFTNSTGWPDENHYMTTKDLAKIASLVRLEFPEYYPYFAENNFTWNDITQQNRNPMLRKGLGADGLKTGHTKEAGYGLVGSAKRGNRRVTFVISGLKTNEQRTIEAEKIINWAYRDFRVIKIAKKHQIIGEMPVWLGDRKNIDLAPGKDIFILLPVSAEKEIKTFISFKHAMAAPFNKGDLSPAKLIVAHDSGTKTYSKEYELFTTEGSIEGGFVARMKGSIIILFNHVKNLVN